MNKEYCPTCGQSCMRHRQSLTPALLQILIKIAVGPLSKKEFHLQKDLDLTKNQYANFQKLQYWMLVVKVPDKPGFWKITSRGHDFLSGMVCLPKWLMTFNSQIKETARVNEYVKIDSIVGDFRYKRREEYSREAEPELSFQKSLF